MSDFVPVWVRPPCPFFKFKPTEEELITHLNLKTLGKESDLDSYIAEVDHICKWQPWELPHFSKIESKTEWWFLCRPDYKNNHSNRSNRTTKTGYWKKTGKECNTKGCDGRKRILVFHDGSSSGKRTDWVLHEYYSLQPNVAFSLQKPDYVICRLKRKQQEKGQNECEMASDLGNPLVSTTTTMVNNVISSPQQQLCSPELCNTEALPDEDIWALIDMPEFSWDELEKCLVSAEITYNSSNMRDPSMSLHDGPLSSNTQAVEINEPYIQTWRAEVHLVRFLAQRKSRVSEWFRHQLKLYIILWIKIPYKKQLFPLFIRVSKWMLLLLAKRHSKRSSAV